MEFPIYCLSLSAGDRPFRCVYCWPLPGHISWFVSALHAVLYLPIPNYFTSSWKVSCSYCFPLSTSYLVMPFMGTDLGKLMKLHKLSEDKIQYLVYQMLKGLKVKNSTIMRVDNLLLYHVIVLLIKLLFYSFITVYSFCWYNSQGKLSLVFPPYLYDKDCVHTLLPHCKGSWCFLSCLHSHSSSFHINFCRTSNQEILPSIKIVSSRYNDVTTQTKTTHHVDKFIDSSIQ